MYVYVGEGKKRDLDLTYKELFVLHTFMMHKTSLENFLPNSGGMSSYDDPQIKGINPFLPNCSSYF